jgi:hypothetical protein
MTQDSVTTLEHIDPMQARTLPTQLTPPASAEQAAKADGVRQQTAGMALRIYAIKAMSGLNTLDHLSMYPVTAAGSSSK